MSIASKLSTPSFAHEFSPRASRALLVACVSVVSFAFGAHWSHTDALTAPVETRVDFAALPVVPSAAQAEAMTPRLPASTDDAEEMAPTF